MNLTQIILQSDTKDIASTTTYSVVNKDYDRIIYITINQKDEVVGLNFHQGIDEIDESFIESNDHIMAIYNRLSERKFEESERITMAIEWYVRAFIFGDEGANN